MSSSSQEQSPPPSKSPTMEVDQQNQPQLMASVTTQNLDDTSPTNHHQQVEQEEEQAFTTAPNNVNWLENEFFDIGTDIGDIDCFDLPPGYRFCPYDDELVVHYLKKKVMNQPLPHNMIKDVKLYDYNPDFLTGLHPYVGEKQWYFFTPRDRKYRNGNRPNRAAGNGYWKATGADKTIKFEGVPVGFRKALVFYLGRPPKGEKTSWIMHEFRVDGPPRTRRDPSDMKLDDWVLCRIYKKAEKLNRAEEPDQNSSALSEENSPRVNENDITEMNCDYNNIGDSKGLMKTYGGCLQSPFQMGFPEIPRFTDSLSHFGKLSVHYPTLSINYGAQPVGFGTPDLVHSTESIFGSKYLKEHGLDSKPRVFHEDIWSNTDLDNCDLDLEYDFSCSNDDMDLGDILPDNAQT